MPISGRLIGLGALAWLALVAVDFFLHAGLLARLYLRPSSFLLPPEEAFRRIPLGYLSLVLLAVLLIWLMTRLGIDGWRRGLVFGLALGGLTGAAAALGLASVSTARPALMLGWIAAQTIELGVAGAVVGSGLAGTSLRRILVGVLLLVLASATATIALQSLGWAPVPRISD